MSNFFHILLVISSLVHTFAIHTKICSFCRDKECKCPDENVMQLNNILSEQVVYDEIAVLNKRLQTDCQVPTVTYSIKKTEVLITVDSWQF